MTITPEQRAELIEALERGGDTTLCLPPFTRDGGPDEYNQLTPAGRLLAESYRENEALRAAFEQACETAESHIEVSLIVRLRDAVATMRANRERWGK